MASKPSRTTNFSEQEKLLLAELGRDFPEVESKGYDSKTLAKKTKAWEEILTKFNHQNLNGIKSDLSQLQGCWRRLKLRSKKEHDLHRREARKTGMHQIGLFSSASVVPQSKSTELCSSAAVIQQSLTRMWSSAAPFRHWTQFYDIYYLHFITLFLHYISSFFLVFDMMKLSQENRYV